MTNLDSQVHIRLLVLSRSLKIELCKLEGMISVVIFAVIDHFYLCAWGFLACRRGWTLFCFLLVIYSRKPNL